MFKRLLPFVLVLPLSAIAEVNNKDVAKCAVIKGDLARLECYDTLAKANHLNGPQSQTLTNQDLGKWAIDADINPIDDSRTSTAMLLADSGTDKWGKPVYLIIRCKSKVTDLYIGWRDYLGSSSSVLTRIGTNDAAEERWDLSTDSNTTFKPKPVPFIKQMLTANKLVAQTTPYNESPTTAIFDTTGMANAVKDVRENCGW